MSSFATLKVAELKEQCERRGLDATGKKAELVARLEGDAATNPSPAGGAASGTPNLDPSDMKVSELKDALGKEGLSTTGKKDELVARLRQAHSGKRPADAAAGGGQPSSKKAKVAAGPAWFWAADIGAGGREWRAYAADVCASLEKAILDVDLTEQQVTADHVVVLAPNATTGLYVQRSRANPSLTRPVARTQDGRPPASPPPQPKGPPSAARSSAPAAPAASSSLASSSAAGASVAKKSVKAGGVQQVRYNAKSAASSGTSSGMRKEIVKGRAAVDPSCPKAEVCHVYEEGDDVHDAYLNQTNIQDNKNKYYIIQMLETDAAPHQYFCWNRWGRVGEERNAQNALRGPMGLSQAKQDHAQKFKDKTKNEWDRRADFKPAKDKYTLIERDYGQDDAPADDAAAKDDGGEERKPVECKLDPRVQAFVRLIADVKMMESQMREIGFDPNKMPLGKLKKSTVMQGYQVLQELSTLIVGASASSASSGGGSASSSSGGTGSGVAARDKDRMLDLSNQFYSLIPHTADGESGTRTRLDPIDNAQLLKKKIQMVEALGNIELANRVIDTKSAAFDTHPIDARYSQLNTEMRPIDVGSELHQMLDTYLQQTHATTHSQYTIKLEQAFEVNREGEAAAFKSSIGNRQLLWHGSRLTNWCGILSGGLRIAPPEAPVTGYMFGKGVYFANMSSKSANYCFANRQASKGVLLLCDVALGKQYLRSSAEYEADKSCRKAKSDSTLGQGKTAPDAAGYRKLPDDAKVTVPMGKGKASDVKNSSLLYDEFIVYDVAQIRQKYVLQVDFQFKSHGGLL